MPAHKMTADEKTKFLARAASGERLVDLAKEFDISFRHAQRIWKDELAIASANAKEEIEKGYPYWEARGVKLPPLGNAPATRAWANSVLAAYRKQFGPTDPETEAYVSGLEKEINALTDKEIINSERILHLRNDAAEIVRARNPLSDEAIEAMQRKPFFENTGTPLNDLRAHRIVEGIQNLIELGLIKSKNGMVSKA